MIINHEISHTAFWRSHPVRSADKSDKSGFDMTKSVLSLRRANLSADRQGRQAAGRFRNKNINR